MVFNPTAPLPRGATTCTPPMFLNPGVTFANLPLSTRVYVVLNGREPGIHQDLWVTTLSI
jgi:hypothetical protein